MESARKFYVKNVGDEVVTTHYTRKQTATHNINTPPGSTFMIDAGTTITLDDGSTFTTQNNFTFNNDKQIVIRLHRSSSSNRKTKGGRLTKRKTNSSKGKSKRNKRYIV